MSTNRLDALIDELSGDLQPVKRMAHPFLRTLPWVIVSLAYVAGVVGFLGLRPDWPNKITDHFFIFEIMMGLSVSISAAFAAGWLNIPDMREQKWLKAIPVTLFTVLLFWMTCRGCIEGVHMPYLGWDHCFSDAILLGLIPAAFIVFLSKNGTTTQPSWMTTMNVLAVSGLGWVGLRFTCSLDDVGHAGFYHFAPFVVFGVLMGIFARRIFRW